MTFDIVNKFAPVILALHVLNHLTFLNNLYLKSYSNVKFFKRRNEAFLTQKVEAA